MISIKGQKYPYVIKEWPLIPILAVILYKDVVMNLKGQVADSVSNRVKVCLFVTLRTTLILNE